MLYSMKRTIYLLNEIKSVLIIRFILILLRLFSDNKCTKHTVNLPSYGDAELGKRLVRGDFIFSGVKFSCLKIS